MAVCWWILSYLLACPSRGWGTAQRELFNIFLVMVFSPPALALYRCCWILYSTYGSSTSLLHRFDFFFCSCHKPRYLPIILNVFVFPQKPYSLFIFWRGISFVIDESGVKWKGTDEANVFDVFSGKTRRHDGIAYRCEDRKQVGELRGGIGAIQ